MLAAINYHYIRKDFNNKYPSIFGITPEKFRSQLELLSKYGKFISSDDLVALIEKDIELYKNKKLIILTFDDGLKEQYNYALPILEDMGIPAVFFVNTSSVLDQKIQNVHKIHIVRSLLSPQEILYYLNKEGHEIIDESINKKALEHYKYDIKEVAILKYFLNFKLPFNKLNKIVNFLFNLVVPNNKNIHNNLYMSKNELIDLNKKGYLGSHSEFHIPLGEFPKNIREKQINNSQKTFKNFLNGEVNGFSFPYGSLESSKGCKNILYKSNFKYAFTMERAINHDLKQNFALSRFDNNDMPFGKNYNYSDNNFFDKMNKRKWVVKS